MANYVDSTGWVYVTEANGGSTCNNYPTCNCGDVSTTGSALADFENNANAQFQVQAPHFLQAVYGYILMQSDCGATSDGWTAIDTNYISGYNDRRSALGF